MADTNQRTGNEESMREITVGGKVEDSVVVSGSHNVINLNAPAPQQDGGPAFRVLTVVARALDVSELPDIADAWSLADGLRAVNAPVEICFVRPPTRERLELVLDGAWDVLHFDGHGTADAGGFLLFETEDGLSQLVSTDELIARLKRSGQLPKLVILSACQSAKGDGDGLAGKLAREAGAPAVIGFSETVPVDLTMAFVGRLYAALGAGRTIAEAFNSARDSLSTFRKVTLVPESAGATSRTIPAINFPVLTGSGADQALCPIGLHGRATMDRELLVGVPAPSESGRFYGVFEGGDPPAGRKGLLARAARSLLDGEKLLVLHGQGGIGKSALAAALARRLAWRYPGGVFWVNGADYVESGLHLDDALNVFAAVCGADFLKANTAQKRQAALAYLEQWDKPSLWIIDNAEAADEAVWQAARHAGGRSAVLLTTRDKPEYGGSLLDVAGMAADEALPFLVEEVRRRKGELQWGEALSESQLHSLFEIARLVDGHALALLHAAALVADEGLASAERLVRANPASGETARRFDFSYKRLTPGESALFHRLAAFAAAFDAQAVQAVCTDALDEQDTDLLPDWEADLRGLARKSFVEVNRWNEDYHRYRLHPVLREYARSKAAPSLARDQWRMANYYGRMADAAAKLLGDTGRALDAVAFAKRERLNLLAAQEVCLVQGQDEAVIFLAYDLNNLFNRSGHWNARRAVLQVGLCATQKIGGQNHAGLLHNSGMLAEETGDYSEARRLYQESLEIKRQLDDTVEIAISLHQLGNLAYQQGDYTEARRLYSEAGALFKSLGAQREQAAILHQLGMLSHATGDHSEARCLYQESLEINQQLGDKAGVADILGQQGILAQDTGDYAEARRLYQQSLEINQQLGKRVGIATSLHQLGVLAYLQGDYAEARHLCQKSLEINQQLGNRANMATGLLLLGMLTHAAGDYTEARCLCQESLDINQQLGNKAGVALSLHQLDLMAEDEGDWTNALDLTCQAEAILAALGSPDAKIATQSRERIERAMREKAEKAENRE